MTDENEKLKEETSQDFRAELPWYHFSRNTWFLIAGLAFYNYVCFTNPVFLDSVLRRLDVRLWPWWYFSCLVVIVIFSIIRFVQQKNQGKQVI